MLWSLTKRLHESLEKEAYAKLLYLPASDERGGGNINILKQL